MVTFSPSRRSERAPWLIALCVSVLGCSSQHLSPASSTGTGGQAGTVALAGDAGAGGGGGDTVDAGNDARGGTGGTGDVGGGGAAGVAGGPGGAAGAGGQPAPTCRSPFCDEVDVILDGAIAEGTSYTIRFDDNSSEHQGGVLTCTLSSSADGQESIVCNGWYLHANSGTRKLVIANRPSNLGVAITRVTDPTVSQNLFFQPTYTTCGSCRTATINVALP